MKKINIIVACDLNYGIGKNNKIPWNYKSDMSHFKNITCTTKDIFKKNAVIMGSKTWDSIPDKFKPLPHRQNCIITRSPDKYFEIINCDNSNQNQENELLEVHNDINKCIKSLYNNDNIENIFVIGGSQIYNWFLKNNLYHTIYLTRIKENYDCDTTFNISDTLTYYHNFSYEKDTEYFKEDQLTLEKYTNINFPIDYLEKNNILNSTQY
jgi:dihydrofolate reductase